MRKNLSKSVVETGIFRPLQIYEGEIKKIIQKVSAVLKCFDPITKLGGLLKCSVIYEGVLSPIYSEQTILKNFQKMSLVLQFYVPIKKVGGDLH